MATSIESLVLDDLFQIEIMRAIDMVDRQDTFSRIQSYFKVDKDGNIVNINEIPVAENVSHQLTYLIGSINFLFSMANDEIFVSELSAQRRSELNNSCRKTVGLLIDLLSELLESDSLETVNNIIEKISERKTAIKLEMGL